MFFQKPKIEVLATHQSDFAFIHGDNLLFFLRNGKSQLKNCWYTIETDATPYEMGYSALTLNDIPLIHVQSSGSPTCESLLAAGYGMPEDCVEIRQTADNLLRPYTNLEDALKRLTPVIGLLMTGAYMLSVSDYFPTDGTGHFFWDVSNDFIAVEATAGLYDPSNIRCLPNFPCYLYPSQPTAKYDAARVDYYRTKLRIGESIPPALVYNVGSYISVLLDGHHRACACALEGRNLPCLTLSPAYYSMNISREINTIDWLVGYNRKVPPLTERQVKMLKMSIHGEQVQRNSTPKAGEIFSNNWPPEYHEAACFFPTCREAAALAIYPYAKITPDGIHDLANCTENDESESATALLRYLSRQKDTNKKAFAMLFTACGYCAKLRREAFRILCAMKNDPEIEDFFVDYLVNFEDRTDPLWKIANSYWKET